MFYAVDVALYSFIKLIGAADCPQTIGLTLILTNMCKSFRKGSTGQ